MRVKTGLHVGMLVTLMGVVGCGWLTKPAPPICQGDPQLKPCTCMDPRTADCPPPPSDAKKPNPDSGATP